MKAGIQAEIQKGNIVYARVWQSPIRLAHWLMFGSVVTLGITGYLIGNPSFSVPTEASKAYSLGTIRFIHLTAAYVLLSAFLLRLYWGFAGNRFCKWTTMLPLKKHRWKAIFLEGLDLLWPKGRLRIFTGHSPLANIVYLGVYAGVLFSILTGFILHSHSKYEPAWRMIAGWGTSLFGNLNNVHFFHHIMIWFFALFLIVHLYLVIYTVVVSRTTEIDTMVSGHKFVFTEELAKGGE